MAMNIIPLPFRDLIHCTQKKLELQHSISVDQPSVRNASIALRNIHYRISIATAESLMASGIFLLCGNGWKTTVSVIALGSCASLPAAAIAGGTHVMGLGIYNLISCLSTGVFTNFAENLAATLGGWLILENYNILPFGLVEENKMHDQHSD